MEVVSVINKAVIKYENLVLMDCKRNLKEEIKMSLINMAMNIGHFDINISIKKDMDRKREILAKRAKQNQRIKEILEKRNNLLANYHIHDYMG
jgi:GH24 family phage-related lysozyme (muramidase)